MKIKKARRWYIPQNTQGVFLSLASGERRRDHDEANEVSCCSSHFDCGDAGHKKAYVQTHEHRGALSLSIPFSISICHMLREG